MLHCPPLTYVVGVEESLDRRCLDRRCNGLRSVLQLSDDDSTSISILKRKRKRKRILRIRWSRNRAKAMVRARQEARSGNRFMELAGLAEACNGLSPVDGLGHSPAKMSRLDAADMARIASPRRET